MKNTQISQIFHQIADVLEFDGVAFKPQAYRRAAIKIENFDFDICEIGGIKELKKIPGIGEAIAQKIVEICETGKLEYLEKLRKEIEVDLENLQKIEGLGPKKLKKIANALDIKTVADLKQVAQKGLIKELEGFGAKSEINILKNIDLIEKRTHRFPYGHIAPEVKDFLEKLKKIPEVEKAEIAGSFRRHKETIGDLDILIITKDAKKISETVEKFPEVISIIANGPTKMSFDLESGLRTDLRFLEEKCFGSALMYFTGNKEFNIKIRSLSIRYGWKLNEYGLFEDEKIIAGKTEKEIFKKLKLNYIPPECREDNGEIEIAQREKFDFILRKKLPKGDLHMHTKYSDGENTMEEMTEKALELGHKYIAFSDHSGSLAVANPLNKENFPLYFAEIEKLNKKYLQIRILKSAEVNILVDGCLDLEEKWLKKLDIVIGSIHTGMHDFDNIEKNTKRYLKALDNPYLNIIGHPTTRRFNQKEMLDVDYKTVFEKAKARRVALELNSTPDRLDLPVHLLRLAKSVGNKIVINTDSHTIRSLPNLWLGVYQARRAFLEKSDVLNYLDVNGFLNWFKKP